MARQIFNRTITVDGIDIFYRETGDRTNPSILLLHGFPSSSIMFKNLMIALSDKFHLIAPDYPGFGFSAFPDKKHFDYTFQNISAYINRFTEEINLHSFTVYLHDYGCPIGLRICMNNPEKIEKIIVQDGNAYEEGIVPQWDEVRDYWEHPFRTYQPPTLVIWGKYDPFFNVNEAPCYKRDIPDAQIHILNGGHEVLETNFDEVLHLIENFLTHEKSATK